MKKALICAHVAYAIELFNIPNIELLIEMGYEVSVACNFQDRSSLSEERAQSLIKKLDSLGVKRYDLPFQRSPFKQYNLKAFFSLKKLISEQKYDLIHCHTPVGGILTRLASIGARKNGTKVIYTAHGFHFYKGAPIVNWLIYFSAEKLCSYFTDVLITINGEDFSAAKRLLSAKKNIYIPGVGIDTNKFSFSSVDKNEKLAEIGLNENSKIILCVGELSKRKNHQCIIKALAVLKDKNIHLLIAGIGELKDELQSLAVSLGVEDNVHFLGFRQDVAELCSICDVYAFPSLQEGLPVAVMEAMAVGKPCVCSEIRGNTDLIDEKGGFLCDCSDAEGFARCIGLLLNNDEMRVSMSQYNKEKAKKYDFSAVREIMKGIYN